MDGFKIQSKLGDGAYSVVHKVIRNADDKIYALKKVKLLNLSEKEKLNALNEVRILASIKSNFVICYKEAFFDENESCLGIVMEFADKGDLYQRITEFKKAGIYFEESDIWRIFIQMVKGIKALHDLKILHRDLKSANIFLFNDGSAKLGDLNVSKVANRGLGYTQTGTPYYASPEVWKDQPYDSKSDIWSLGCVLYEMISLKPPFRAENMEGLFNKVTKGQFSKIPERFSSDLSDIVKLLLQVNPESRPSCDQILKHPSILKRTDIVKNFTTDENNDINPNLLQTIRIPKNLVILTEKLPQKNYNTSNLTGKNINNNQFPEILNRKPKIKKQRKDKDKENQGSVAEPHEAFHTQEDNTRSRKKNPKELNSELDIKQRVEALLHSKPTINNSDKNEEKKSPRNHYKEYKIGEDLTRNDSSTINLPVINLAEILDKKMEKKVVDKSDYYSIESEFLQKRHNDKEKNILKILTNKKHHNNDEIYKIYEMNIKNESVKSKIDRSVGIRYDMYRHKRINPNLNPSMNYNQNNLNSIQNISNDQKLTLLPRKLSPIRKNKAVRNRTSEDVE